MTTARVIVGVAVAAVLAAGCGSSDSPAAHGWATAYCAQLAEIDALDLLADPAPVHVRHDLEQLLALTRRAAAAAPVEMRADARASVRAQEQFNALYAAHGWRPDPTNADPAFIERSRDTALGALYLRLEHYQARTCHADDRPSSPPTIPPA